MASHNLIELNRPDQSAGHDFGLAGKLKPQRERYAQYPLLHGLVWQNVVNKQGSTKGVFMIKKVHHINFIVKDLAKAVERYRILFGEPVGEAETLPQRGVKLARFKVGETWLILVQPVDTEGLPAQYLKEHGEGFFLISCQVNDVRKAAGLISSKGVRVLDQLPREGLDDWEVMDLNPDDLFGVNFQLVESAS
jgi:methylmalonyl-CoA/ethylmalonyl-CoA epimerase